MLNQLLVPRRGFRADDYYDSERLEGLMKRGKKWNNNLCHSTWIVSPAAAFLIPPPLIYNRGIYLSAHLFIYLLQEMLQLAYNTGAKLQVMNNQNLTPLTLAAHLAKKEVSRTHLLLYRISDELVRKTVSWSLSSLSYHSSLILPSN